MFESERAAQAPAAGPASLLRRSDLPCPLGGIPLPCPDSDATHLPVTASTVYIGRCVAQVCVGAQHAAWPRGRSRCSSYYKGARTQALARAQGRALVNSHTHTAKCASRGAPDVCRHVCSLLCMWEAGGRGQGMLSCMLWLPCRHTQRVCWVWEWGSVVVGVGLLFGANIAARNRKSGRVVSCGGWSGIMVGSCSSQIGLV